MTTILHARIDEKRIAKVARIQSQTGLTVSQLLRSLIDAVEVKPAEIAVRLSQKTEIDTTRQGNSVDLSA